MLARILTGVIGIPLFLGLLYIGKWPLFALVAGMGLIGFHEYTRMWQVKGVRVAHVLGSLFLLGILAWAALAPGNAIYLGALFALAVIATLAWLIFRYGDRTIVDALVTLSGVVYVGWLLSHLLLLRDLGAGTGWDLGLKWVTLAFLSTWATDTMAYFTGTAFSKLASGTHKLAPKLSPAKSVEGVIGGVVSALVVGWFWGPVVAIHPWQGALISLVAAVACVLGDLAESALKRYTGVKDSGRLLPGHGGVLDRFDSSLFVLPIVYYIARIFFI